MENTTSPFSPKRIGSFIGYVVIAIAVVTLVSMSLAYDRVFTTWFLVITVVGIIAYVVVRPDTARAKAAFILAILAVLGVFTLVSWKIGNDRAVDTNKPNHGVTVVDG